MSDRPPSAPSPPSPSALTTSSTDDSVDDRVLVTTPQFAAGLEDAVGYSLDEDALEDLLLELDRGEYVEWVAVTRAGDHVWDLSESPDRIADAVAALVADRVRSWLGAGDGRGE